VSVISPEATAPPQNLPPRLPPYTPVRTLMVYLTEDCNLRCTYCFVDKKRRTMTVATARKAIDFFLSGAVSGTEYTLQVNFFGGEPFMATEPMEAMIDYAGEAASRAGRRIVFGATTNATIFTERIARLIRRADMSILLSMDGGPEVTAHDRPFVSGRSSYGAVLRNLPRFKEAAGDLVVRTTYHPGALNLTERVDKLLSLGVPSIALCPVMDYDWAPHVDATEQAFDELATWFLERARPAWVPPLEMTGQLLRLWHHHLKGGTRPRRPCPVAGSLLGVDPDGNVMPCHRFLYRRWDWLTTVDDPARLSEKRRPYLELDSRKIADCTSCAAAPICGGGCRVVALGAGLGLQDAYLGHCIPMRAHHGAVVRIYNGLQERGWLKVALSARPRLTAGLQELMFTG